MENRLFEYMNRRIGGDFVPSEAIYEAGPVITISRQTGCGARRIAWAICEELNKRKLSHKADQKWNYINREILQASAEQLHLDPMVLNHVITDKDRGIMDQIVDALSSHSHKSDQKILKTVQEVIRQFGNKGNVIIIGRGGASICKDIKRSLHIRIEAPEEWRIAEIARRMDFSKAYATEYVHRRDAERQLLVTKLLGSKPDNLVYDIEINHSRFTEKEIIDAILHLALIKGLV
ncbi:MAG: cytidylate kinase-like family protein [Bacteroidota bacterium]